MIMKFPHTLLFLSLLVKVDSFVAKSHVKPIFSTVVSRHQHQSPSGRLLEQIVPLTRGSGGVGKNSCDRYGTNLAAANISDNVSGDDESGILPAAVAVGSITAAMGFLYGKLLGISRKTLWYTLPNIAAAMGERAGGIAINPVYYITGMFTLGGILMGLLSSKFKSSFVVADFVSAFSSVPAETLPQSRVNLFPVLLLALVTSAFGFSVGPEAPMVCAGGLVGASLARFWYGKVQNNKGDTTHQEEILAYAGAAGSLTAFMGIPIAGSVFALEMTGKSAGLSTSGADKALSPSIIASVAALVLLRAVILPTSSVEGHFDYGSIVGTLSGRAMITNAVVFGIGGALLGTVFHKTVAALKKVVWSSTNTTTKKVQPYWKRNMLVKTTIGLVVGLLSSYYPQTMFWGEGSLQSMIDGQRTAFAATKHGLPALLTGAAKVNPNLPFATSGAALQIGVVKMAAIVLACAGKFPGGIIFPLFFAAAPFAHAATSFMFSSGIAASANIGLAVMCLMASTQASATRTPLATALILSLTASSSTGLSVMLPACLVSSYLGVYVSEWISRKSYFQYSSST